MLFKISHVKADGTMAKIQNVEAGSLYGAYKAYLEEHKGVDVMAVFNAGDKDAVKAVKAGSKSKEDKTMKTNSAVNTAKASKKTSKKTAPKAEIKKTPVVKKAQAQTESVGVKATFTLNEEHNGIEIKFNEKPSKEVREQLKGLKFRWHQTKGLWYAKQSPETIALAEKICGAKASLLSSDQMNSCNTFEDADKICEKELSVRLISSDEVVLTVPAMSVVNLTICVK